MVNVKFYLVNNKYMSLSTKNLSYEREVIEQEGKKLEYYTERANEKREDTAEGMLFIHMSLQEILTKLSTTIINIINEISEGKANTLNGFMMVLFAGDRMIYVGLVILFLSFSIYIIDITS